MSKKHSKEKKTIDRRDFLKRSAAITAAASAAFPAIVPSSVFGANAPSNRITIGCIGVGRIAYTDDIPGLLRFGEVQIVAVSDVDSNRMKSAKELVENHYAAKVGKDSYSGVTMLGDYRELAARKDIDAVTVCTPDHWHVLPAMAAARAGKDIFIQKPLSLTIAEGRALSDTVKQHNNVLLVGSQQRSHKHFRRACELVRNGRIGKLHTIKVGLPTDPGCGEEPEMPVPEGLNYDMWLGSCPKVPYTEKRVHPPEGYDRPGWLRIQAYGAGMITGWGSHHLDTAQWAMGTEHTGRVEVKAEAAFPESGLWDVHGDFEIEYTYSSGVKLICADNKKNKQGVLFEGSDGWIYVKRWSITAEPESVLTSEIGPDEIQLYKSDDHKKNFLDCIRSRGPTVAPVEVGHRSCTVCLLGAIAMNLGRKLKWNPEKEMFEGDEEASSMLSRPMRKPWTL